LVEDLRDRGGVALAERSQRDALARQPGEERALEPGLEGLDLLADGAGGDGELVARPLVVEMP